MLESFDLFGMPYYYAYGIRSDTNVSSVNQLCKVVIHQTCISVSIRSGLIEIHEIILQIERNCFTQGIYCYESASCSVSRDEEILDKIKDV